jgi:hypothetical protein
MPPEAKKEFAGSVLDVIHALCPKSVEGAPDNGCEAWAGSEASLKTACALLAGVAGASGPVASKPGRDDDGVTGAAGTGAGRMGAGVLGPPGLFEPPRVSVAVTVAVAALVPLTAPVAVDINPAATPATCVERATPARLSVALVRTGEPAVVDTACVTAWAMTLELAWATCVMVWVTLAAPAARSTVWVAAVVAADTAELASWVTPEVLLATWETVLVTAGAAALSAWAGTGPASRAVPVVAAAALSTAAAVGVAMAVGLAVWAVAAVVGAGGEAAWTIGAVEDGGVEDCADEETSWVAVVATLGRASVPGVAAPDWSATARVPGSAHRTAAVINRALRRPGSRGEGLQALPSISPDCGGFARTVALYTRSLPKSSQIATL